MAEAAQAAEGGAETGAEGQVADAEGQTAGQANGADGGSEGQEAAPWYSGIEDKKVLDFAKKHTAPADLAKTAFEFRQKLSTAVSLPGEGASEEELAEFNQKLGVPKEPGDYNLALPEDFPEDLKDGAEVFLGDLAAVMHEAGERPTAARKVTEFLTGWYAKTQNEAVEGLKKQNEAALSALKKEWGPDFEKNKNVALRAADPKSDMARALGLDDPRYQEFFNEAVVGDTTVGSHPLMIKLLATVAARQLEAEHREGMSTEDQAAGTQKMSDLTQQIHAAVSKGDSTLAQRLNTERDALAEKLYGTDPVVGEAGRTA